MSTMTAKEILEEVLSYTEMTVNSLASEIGLTRAQALYDIQNEKTKSITKSMADRINQKFPELSRVWLLTGEGSMIVGDNRESAGVNVTGTGNHVSHNHVGGTDRTPPSGYYDALKESQRQTTQLIQSLQTAQELQTNTQAQLDKLLARLADSQAQIARLIQLLSDKTDK